ncbi:hypothetical protein [Listeria booriae]|uniref:hypothetical protein n=1 Tax=Listeria booriae TaxID=1552123 RepID=UPI0016275F99|nr:hypothetical protein [Listeria booriae]MBC2106147.1 hypothetical protein [Listeria booriae]
MAGKFELNFKDSERLENTMKLIPENAERLVNEELHVHGAKKMMQAIIDFMPVSARKKNHARDSNSLKFDKLNLGFRIYAKGGAANRKGSYGYLVFPDEGRGSSNPIAQKFFSRGAEKENGAIIDGVIRALEKATNMEG